MQRIEIEIEIEIGEKIVIRIEIGIVIPKEDQSQRIVIKIESIIVIITIDMPTMMSATGQKGIESRVEIETEIEKKTKKGTEIESVTVSDTKSLDLGHMNVFGEDRALAQRKNIPRHRNIRIVSRVKLMGIDLAISLSN